MTSNNTNLTRDEAVQRSNLIDVYGYDVSFDLSRVAQAEQFESRSTVRFACTRQGGHTWIDILADDVMVVELNGSRLDPDQIVHGDRIVLQGLCADNTLTVKARHTAGHGRGLNRSVDPADDRVYVWTQFEPYDARRAFACFDQPDLKAQFRFTAAVPREWRCISNGAVASIRDEGETRWWSFARTPVLPTYVTGLCAGPFHSVEDFGELPVAVHAPRSRAVALDRDAQELLTLTRQGLDLFGSQFGTPFAGSRYDCVFVPGQPGAMENYGCVTWNDSALPRSTPAADRRARRRFVLLHEMAHMWFGNLVSFTWWDDLWLKESFADWAGFWASSRIPGGQAAWTQFLLTHKVRGYAADQSPTTHPISRVVDDIESAEASFDMVTYAKGASVLQQLAARMGTDRFLAGLRSYFAKYAWHNADLRALLSELEMAADEDLTAWAESWLRRSGVNTLHIDAPITEGRYHDVTISQNGDPARPHRLRLGYYDHDSTGRLVRREEIDVDVTGDVTAIPALEGRAQAVLLPDDDDLTFAKARCDTASLQAIVDGAHTLQSAIARARALVMVREMMLDGELAATVLIGMVSRYLAIEEDPVVLGHLVAIGVESATIYTATRHRDRDMSALATAILRTRNAADPESTRASLDRGLAQLATTESQLDALKALLTDRETDQATRWAALTRLVALGHAGADEIASERSRDSNPDMADCARAALAARPTAAAKDAAFDTLLRPGDLTTTAREQLAAAFWQPGQDQILAPYARTYLQRLPGLAEAGSTALQSGLIQRTFPFYGFPSHASGDQFVAEVNTLAHEVEAPLKVRLEIIDQAHRLAVALRVRHVDEAT